MQDPTGQPPTYSVVVPFFNEEDNVEPLLDELLPVMESLGASFEILLVDDESSDRGPELAAARAARDARIRLLRLPARQGQSAALALGFRAVRGPMVITIDADLQNDPADIPRLLDAARDHDVVCGIRRERHDTWVRRVSSRFANAVRNRATGDRVTDVGCSLRVMRADLLDRLPLFSGMHRFLPTLLKMAGGSVTEIEVNHRPRLRGESKYGIGNRAWRGLVDLMGVRWLQRRRIELPREAARDPQVAERDGSRRGSPTGSRSSAASGSRR